MWRLNIRWKLTLWYGAVLAVMLTLFSVAVFLVLRHQLLARIDQGLNEELADVLSEIKRHDNEAALSEWLDRRFAHHEGFDFEILNEAGQPYFLSARMKDRSWRFPPSAAERNEARYETAPIGKAGRWRILGSHVDGPLGMFDVKVGRSLTHFDHESSELLFTFLLTCPLVLVFAVGGGYFLAGRALRPVHEITHTARQITADRLSCRIPIENAHDEIGELAQTLNQMIERLESSFTEMQRFTADAAHELRTPLAVIRSEAEVALRSRRSPDEYTAVLENLLLETERLTNLAEQLLFLCRHDAGLIDNRRERIDLTALLEQVVGNMQPLASEKGLTLSMLSSEPHEVLADSNQLRRVAYNLLDNAIKFTPAGGSVLVAVSRTTARVLLSIADTGVGIAAEHLDHVLKRFYRADPARPAGEHGAGLGLAICDSIVRGLGGTIGIESTPGQGTKVTISLPVASQLPLPERFSRPEISTAST